MTTDIITCSRDLAQAIGIEAAVLHEQLLELADGAPVIETDDDTLRLSTCLGRRALKVAFDALVVNGYIRYTTRYTTTEACETFTTRIITFTK